MGLLTYLQTNKKGRIFLSAFLAGTMVFSMTACGSGSKNTETTAQQAKETPAGQTTAAGDTTGAAETAAEAALETVSLMVNYTGAEAPTDDNPLILKIAEYTGTTPKVIWVPQSAYNEKLNTLIASKDLPQITTIREVKASGFVNAARSGMFWDVGPYLDRFPNLSKIDPTILKNVQIDGQQFLIPKVRDVAREGGILRQDWLDNLGLEMPATLDELHDVLYAFTYNDPDKNGVDDTYGFSLKYNALPRFSTLLSIYMGGPNTWGLDEEGNVVPEFYFNTYTKSLTWFREAYAEKLFNQDFPICKDEMQNFTSGAAGMLFLGNLEDAATRVTDLNAVFPDATTDIFQLLKESPDAPYHITGYQGYTGGLAFSKTSVKTEEELLSLLAFIDKLGEPEMADCMNWGVEGESYTVKDGGVEQTKEQSEIYARKYNDIRQITPFYTTKNLEANNQPELNKKIVQLMNENAQYAVHNMVLPYISDTNIETGGDLTVQIDDAKIKYVIGELDLDGWKAAIEDWKAAGGEQIIKEYTEQYKANN